MSIGTTVAEADKAVRAAERRKLPVPDAIREAAAVRATVTATGRLPDPERPALPDQAADAARVIAEHAEALRLADVTRRAADLFRDEADARYTAAVRAAVPDWVTGLDTEFRGLVATVRKAAAKLPANVDPQRLNWNSAQHSAAWQRAEGAAVQLEQLVSDRDDIARAEGPDGGRDRALFAVAAVPQPTVEAVMTRQWNTQYVPVLDRWRELSRQPVTKWVHLVRSEGLTLSLATPGEVSRRYADVQLWRDAGHARMAGQTLSAAQAAVDTLLRERGAAA